MRSQYCVSVYTPLSTFECLNQPLSNLVVYIMPPEFITKAFFIYPSHLSVCLYVNTTTAARQRLGKNVTAAMNTHAIEELLNTSFSTRPVSYQRKAGDYFYPKLLAYFLFLELGETKSLSTGTSNRLTVPAPDDL
jgi:hypothetical protein